MILRRDLRRWGLAMIGTGITGFYLFPLYWMYVSSFKSPIELFASPPTIYPHELWLDSYHLIFSRTSLPSYLGNSFFLAGGATVCTLRLAVPAAYAMARMAPRWVQLALVVIMLSQVLPPALLVTPIFIFFRQLNLVGTYPGAILAYITKALPFAVVVLRPIFLRVPIEVDEAARVDGCTRVSVIFRIIVPVARTGILVAGILTFMLIYGEYVYSSALLSGRDVQPATIGLYALIGAEQSNWNDIMAFSSVFVTPVIILFIAMQKLIVRGLMSGAGK